ncbi:MAG: MotE family protein [Holosporales bacterium]
MLLRKLSVVFCAVLLLFAASKGHEVYRAFSATPALAESKPESTKPETEADAGKSEPTTDETVEKDGKQASTDKNDDKNIDAPKDITEFTPSELNLLQSLRERRELIDQRDAALTEREKVLSGLEAQVEAKINELNTIKDQIEQLRADIDQRSKKFRKSEDEQILSLVRVYEKMKPKDAAAIFNNLELTILLDVVKNMKETKLAPIMAAMDNGKAKTLSAELAQRETLPSLPN